MGGTRRKIGHLWFPYGVELSGGGRVLLRVGEKCLGWLSDRRVDGKRGGRYKEG